LITYSQGSKEYLVSKASLRYNTHVTVLFLPILALGLLFSVTSLAYADSVQVVMAKGTASNTNCGDQCYVPSTVSIAVGNSVVWKNADTTAHTATASDGSFDTNLVPAGASASIVFNTAGTYSYSCLLHPWSKGTVVVGDPSIPLTPITPTDNTPTQTPPPTQTQTDTHLIITGKIDPSSWSNNNQMTVTLQLAQILDNGKNVIIRLTQVQPQPDGSFSNDFYVVNQGNYKIIANYGSAKAETPFILDGKSAEISLNLPMLQRPIETKKVAPISDDPIKNEQSPPPESKTLGDPSQPVDKAEIQMMEKSSQSSCANNDSCYSPSKVFLSKGGTITWYNDDVAVHTATSTQDSTEEFDSSMIQPAKSFSYTFNNDGTFSYFCLLHPWAKGTIVVGSGISTPTTPVISANIQLNQQVYTNGEIVSFSGKVTGIKEGEILNVFVIDPNGNQVSGKWKLGVGGRGVISSDSPQTYTIDGKYRLQLKYQNTLLAEKTFDYANSVPSAPKQDTKVQPTQKALADKQTNSLLIKNNNPITNDVQQLQKDVKKVETQTKQQTTTPASKLPTEQSKSNSVVPQITKQVTKQTTTDNLKKAQELAKQKALEKAKELAKQKSKNKSK